MPTLRRHFVLVALGSACLLGVIIYVSRPIFARAAAPPRGVDTELVTALTRVGLAAEPLTAAGLDTTATTDLVGRVKSYVGAHPTAIADADNNYATAKNTCDRVERLVRSGLATQEDVAACARAQADLVAWTANRQQVLDAVFNVGIAGLGQASKDSLTLMRTNGAAWTLPLQFLVVNRSQQDWVHVRQALANEKISAKNAEDPDPDDQQYLSTCRSDPAVSTAKSNLDHNLTSVQEEWLAAVYQ
jgi:hypothetical protein